MIYPPAPETPETRNAGNAGTMAPAPQRTLPVLLWRSLPQTTNPYMPQLTTRSVWMAFQSIGDLHHWRSRVIPELRGKAGGPYGPPPPCSCAGSSKYVFQRSVKDSKRPERPRSKRSILLLQAVVSVAASQPYLTKYTKSSSIPYYTRHPLLYSFTRQPEQIPTWLLPARSSW